MLEIKEGEFINPSQIVKVNTEADGRVRICMTGNITVFTTKYTVEQLVGESNEPSSSKAVETSGKGIRTKRQANKAVQKKG